MDGPVVLLLLVLAAAYLWLAVFTIRRVRRRLAPGRRRVVLLSATISLFFAPTLIAAGHGALILPVALAVPIFLMSGWVRFELEGLKAVIVFLVIPFVAFWVLSMLVGLAAVGLARLRARP
jgi:hypothetical protein